MKFGVGELDGRAVFGFPDQRGLVGVLFEMAVEAVVGDVEFAADKPFGVGRVPFENFVWGLEPVEDLACSAQNVSGSAAARSYISRYSSRDLMRAFLLNSSGGGNRLLFQDMRIEFLHGGDSSMVRVRRALGQRWLFVRPYVIEREGFGQGGDSGR